MKKVYQTIIGAGRGECSRAGLSAHFSMQLDRVQNFIKLGEMS